MYGDFKIYVRPLESFIGRVDRDKYPKVIQEYRFERVNPAELSDRRGREEERPVFKARGKRVPKQKDWARAIDELRREVRIS